MESQYQPTTVDYYEAEEGPLTNSGLENWRDDSNCLRVDSKLLFPESGVSAKEAKEVCRSCEVRE